MLGFIFRRYALTVKTTSRFGYNGKLHGSSLFRIPAVSCPREFDSIDVEKGDHRRIGRTYSS